MLTCSQTSHLMTLPGIFVAVFRLVKTSAGFYHRRGLRVQSFRCCIIRFSLLTNTLKFLRVCARLLFTGTVSINVLLFFVFLSVPLVKFFPFPLVFTRYYQGVRMIDSSAERCLRLPLFSARSTRLSMRFVTSH